MTIYLLKDRYKSDIEKKFPPHNGIQLSEKLPFSGYFFPMPSAPETPEWVLIIQTILKDDSFELKGQHPGGIIFLHYKLKFYAITFGHAWSSIKPNWAEPDFGKRVTLNAITRNKLCELKAEQVFAAWHSSNERAPVPTDFATFDIAADRDLVYSIEGQPEKNIAEILGHSIKGGASLKVTIDFSEITDALNLIFELEESKDYKERWPELDNLTIIKDNEITKKLDEILDNEIQDADAVKKIILTVPTMKRSESLTPSGYYIGPLRKKGKHTHPTNYYLTIQSWLSMLSSKGKKANIDNANHTTVHIFNSENKEISKCTLYECIAFETCLENNGKNRSYILSGGKWYEASDDFIKRINREIEKIPAIENHPLREWGNECEKDYNELCSNPSKGVYSFDAKNIFVGDKKSQFEFCDILDMQSKTLFFVKNIGASNHCSHLSEQVNRTVDLFFSLDDFFRKKLAEKVEQKYPELGTEWLKDKPQSFDYTLCLVSMGRDINNLPLFAKCSLARLFKELSIKNYKVYFIRV